MTQVGDAVAQSIDETRIGPQPGPQTAFAESEADIVIYGGQAGGGKSWAILLEPLRHYANPEFGAVIFRRTSTQIRNEGGLWDESHKLYALMGGVPLEVPLKWEFETGMRVKFAHLQHENDKLNYQGAQIPLIEFDELTHFSRSQFFYMLSRNRSMCGVKPYVRATCNPDADSWVAEFIAWWIDQDTGYPIPERSGVLRWFININDVVIWAHTREELVEKYKNPDLPDDDPTQPMPKSVTFIAASVQDNKKLLEADPGYIANLKALPLVEQERLLGGNWKIRPSAGMYFKRELVTIIDAAPAGLEWVRYWDLAATEKTDSNDPDWTVGVLMAMNPLGQIYVADVRRDRVGPHKVKQMILNTAIADGLNVRIGLSQDPGQAGKSQLADLVTMLSKWTVWSQRETGDKVTRFGPFSSQAMVGNVYVVRGPWNDAYFGAMEGFPDALHDDDPDATSGAYTMLNNTGGAMPFTSARKS